MSPRDSAPVSAGLADYGRRFSCNGRFIDRGDPLDDFSIGRYDFTCGNKEQFRLSQLFCRDLFDSAIGTDAIGYCSGPRLSEGVGLCPASAFGHGLREIGEVNGEPEPQSDLQTETKIFTRRS